MDLHFELDKGERNILADTSEGCISCGKKGMFEGKFGKDSNQVIYGVCPRTLAWLRWHLHGEV